MDTTPLRQLPFRRLWIGQGVSFIGYQLTAVAVPVEIYELTSSSLYVGLLGLAGFVPLLVFGLWGGAVADVVDRRRLLLSSSVVTWSSTLALFVQALIHVNNVPLIFLLVMVQSTGFAISSPTRAAIIPRLVGLPEVPAANALMFTVSNVGTVAGPLFAGLVLGQLGFAGAYGIDAALFTVALYAAARLPALPVEREGPAKPPGLRSVIEGLRFTASSPVLLISLVADLIAMGLAMPRALFPAAAQHNFGGVGAVGWLYASIAIGAVVGGVFSGWMARVSRQGVALVVSIAGWGIAVAFAGLARELWLAVLLLAVAGAFDLVSAIYRQTILQVYAPDEMRGRLQGVYTVVVAGGPRLGDVRAGAVAAGVGVTASWVGGGIACAAVIIVLGLAVPSLRRYRSPV